MRWFKKKPEPEKSGLYRVTIQTEVLVNAVNKIHAVNLTKEIREGMYHSYRDNPRFSISEREVKARKT